MKSVLSIFMILLSLTSVCQCPDSGDATNARLKRLNTLKNRDIVMQVVSNQVSLEDILQCGNDTGRFSDTEFVSIQGYCIFAKWGGAEGCNCHSKDKSTWDIHIVLSTDSLQTNQDSCMIVEVTRKYRDTHPGLTPKTFINHKVDVLGYLFRDDEHIAESANDADAETKNLFRKTPWEIHPVVMILILQ